MYLEIGFVFFGVALLLLVLFCIPLLLKLWRAANDVTITLKVLNERLPAILKNMEDISANINQSTTAINEQVEKYAETSRRVQTLIQQMVSGAELLTPLAIRTPAFQKITEAIALVKGARVFFNVLRGK